MKRILICILLAGCTYEPQLITAPKDMHRYRSDLKTCQDEALKPTPIGERLAIGVFGIVGVAAVAAVDDEAFTSQSDVVDECMARKGYAVAYK